jgi:tricorn protease
MHSIRISILALSGLLIAPSSGRAQNIRMASSPTLSPNGATVAFTWNGDIWLAQTKGGSARQLTHHPAADGYPSFSPNGKYLAFSSSRSGSRQVHLMPYVGGQPKQLTAHTEGFTVEGWHPDGKRVLTSITRDHFWRHGERFHLVNLTNRGPEEVIFDGYGSDGNLSPDGKRLLFTREGERSWRKGYRGPRATQIWLYDLTAKKFTQLVAEDEESRWPLWKPDGKGFYYIAERGGVGNLRVRDLASGKESQLTQFEEDSVMYPTISKDGSTIVFRNLFDLWMFKTDGKSKPSKIALRNAADHTVIRKQRRTLKSATQISYSKDGLEVAFISGGDLWVMDTELREPVQITDTSSFEREPAFSPDGKSIFFVGERKGQPDIFRVARTDEKLFWWQNKKFRIAQLTKDAAEEDSLKISPSGGYIAFTKGRGDLWTMRPDGKEAKRLFESWNTPQFNWSPDSKWLVYAQSDNDFNRDIWIRPIDGSQKPYNLSRHPDNDSNPVWSPDGKTIAFTGRRRGDETDIYFAMLREEDHQTDSRTKKIKKAIDKIKKARAKNSTAKPSSSKSVSKPSAKPATDAKKDPLKPDAKPAADPKKTAAKKPVPKKPALRIDFEDLHERLRHVSIPNSSESGLFWSSDSKRLAFKAKVDAKSGTYYIEPQVSTRPKLLNTKTGSQARWISTGNRILWLSGGVPGALAGTTLSSYTFTARQEIRIPNRFREAFNQAWRTMRDYFYDEKLGGRDWNKIREKYVGMAGECPDGASLANVINLMLGELNGSHLGFYYRGPSYAPSVTSDSWTENTAHLGLRFAPDFKGPGLRVRDVIKGGPSDRKESRISAGEVVTEINGKKIGPETDLTRHLNGIPDRDIQLTIRESKKKKATSRTVTLRPTSYSRARSLLYEKWIDDNQAAVAKASAGTLGYVHIAGMNMTSFYRFEEELFSAAAGKEGLVIDVRENGGGSTTDHLLTILTQPRHAITVPRGGGRGYPQDRKIYASWHKPIVVLCNQNSYSNAEIFSHAVRHLKRGKVVGVPTAGGVISTGGKTIMDIGYLRLPFRGWYRIEDGQDMELKPAMPHHVIWPKPTELPKGKDTQLQKAIKVLKKEVKKEQAKPELKLINSSDR